LGKSSEACWKIWEEKLKGKTAFESGNSPPKVSGNGAPNYAGNVIACAACGERIEDLTGHTCEETESTVAVKSFAPQVIADSTGNWTGNALRFATREEAEGNVRNLYSRWTLVRETRVVESTDAVNYRWTHKGLEAVS
jgi:hypothetical protein